MRNPLKNKYTPPQAPSARKRVGSLLLELICLFDRPDVDSILPQGRIEGKGFLRFFLGARHWQWIPAFAGMTMAETGTLNIVVPAKAGIHRPRSG